MSRRHPRSSHAETEQPEFPIDVRGAVFRGMVDVRSPELQFASFSPERMEFIHGPKLWVVTQKNLIVMRMCPSMVPFTNWVGRLEVRFVNDDDEDDEFAFQALLGRDLTRALDRTGWRHRPQVKRFVDP